MKRKNPILKECQFCGDDFTSWRADANVCSGKCRAALNRHYKKIKKMAKDIFGMLDEINQHAEKRGGILPSGIYQDLKRSHEAIEYVMKNHAYQIDLFAGQDSDWRRDNPLSGEPIMSLSLSSASHE
jgi:predicted nucleic acid-binding Zn ribbon protein